MKSAKSEYFENVLYKEGMEKGLKTSTRRLRHLLKFFNIRVGLRQRTRRRKMHFGVTMGIEDEYEEIKAKTKDFTANVTLFQREKKSYKKVFINLWFVVSQLLTAHNAIVITCWC